MSNISCSTSLIGLLLLSFSSTLGAKEASEISSLQWTWQRDEAGRVIEVKGPGGSLQCITYGAETNAANGESTDILSYGKELRRLTCDKSGRLTRANGGAANVLFAYGTGGLLSEVQTEGCPSLRYGYDALGQLTELRIGHDTVLRYRYDYQGRLSAIITPAGEITYTYQPGENTVARKLPNQVLTQRLYDDEGRLKEITHADAASMILQQYRYAYRPDGLVSVVEASDRRGVRTVNFLYDVMHRLVNVASQGDGASSYRYVYDAMGNLAEAKSGTGETLRLTSSPAGSLLSDSRGVCRTDARGHIRELPLGDGTIDYDYGENGKLAAAKGNSVTYAYDALERLIQRTVAERTTHYLPDPLSNIWQPLWRRDAAGNETVTIYDNGFPLMEIRGQRIIYRLEDFQGSVRSELDAAGQVTAWRDYSPYGKPVAPRDGDGLQFGFAGLPYDPVAGVYLTQARAYDPITARFLQPDPQLRIPGASPQTHSLYAYCGGDPVNWIDVDGAEAKLADMQDSGKNGPLGLDFTQRLKTVYDRTKKKGLYLQVVDDGTHREWLISTLEQYENKAAKELFNDTLQSTLSFSQRQTVRLEAVNRFANDFSSDPFHRPLLLEDYQNHVANMNIATRNGLVNIDWLVTIIQKGRISGPVELITAIMPPDMRYFACKWVNNNIAKPLGGGPKIDPRDPYPKSNLNALSMVKNVLFNSSMSIREIFAPPSDSTIVRSANIAIKLDKPRLDISSSKLNKSRDYNVPFDHPKWPDPEGSIIEEQWPPGGGEGQSASSRFRLGPSPVGGVYLGGAGKALEGMGALVGIAVDDETGNLVLIGEDGRSNTLPPLRLDDVVTVFRAVYNNGQSPTVTINPDKKNPEGPSMDVVHGPGTEGTYVGWVLFECDRVMKTYQLGVDNVSKQPLISKVPGHTETVNAVFSSNGAHVSGHASDGVWERFWIVPDMVRRYDVAANGLSLFDIPLKVKTQKMKWVSGELVDDETGESSAGAKAFTKWFSENYVRISEEVRLVPPQGSGLTEPVAIFQELRRIATITAVAERLRAQGQALPLWMRDYNVAAIHITPTTPSLNLCQTNGLAISSIYGGVNLAPADADIHAYGQTEGARKEPKSKEDIAFVEESRSKVNVLTAQIPEVARLPFDAEHPVKIILAGGEKITAVVLPGATSQALAPNQQSACDLSVPIGLGRSVKLTRFYSSFFDPEGACGKGWTLNLPTLEMTPVPVSRTGKKSEYSEVPTLTSPLGTYNIRFDKRAKVALCGGSELYVAKDHPEIAGVGFGNSPLFKQDLHKVLFQDGSEWHFDATGNLLVEESEGVSTCYERDAAGRVSRILGCIGKQNMGAIALSYDAKGRIEKARAEQPAELRIQLPVDATEITYEYGKDGCLTSILQRNSQESDAVRVMSYSYMGTHLIDLQGTDMRKQTFSYNERGQVIKLEQDGQRVDYAITAADGKTTFTESAADGKDKVSTTYDGQLRPVTMELGKDASVAWEYGAGQSVVERIVEKGRTLVTREISADGKTETEVDHESGEAYKIERDEAGQPTVISYNGAAVVSVNRLQGGAIKSVTLGRSTEVVPLVNEEGWQNGLLVKEPGSKTQWTQEKWDLLGRTIKIEDSTGLECLMSYDDSGKLVTMVNKREGKNYGYQITRDQAGRIQDVDSSWGKKHYSYDADGKLAKVDEKRQGGQASVELISGRVKTVKQFDGGEWHFDYEKDGSRIAQVRAPNNLRMTYGYDSKGQLKEVDYGTYQIACMCDAAERIASLSYNQRSEQRGAETKQLPVHPLNASENVSQWAAIYARTRGANITAPSWANVKVGMLKIESIYRSFTDTRAYLVTEENTDGKQTENRLSIVKVIPNVDKNLEQVEKGIHIQDFLRSKGVAVPDQLPVFEGLNIQANKDVIITHESIAPGEQMSRLRERSPGQMLGEQERRLYIYSMLEIALKGKDLPDDIAFKPAVRTESQMRKRLSKRNEQGKDQFAIFCKSPTYERKLVTGVKQEVEHFHDDFQNFVDVCFGGNNPLSETVYVHDAILPNCFIDVANPMSPKVSIIDVSDDYVGNVGHTFAIMMSQLRPAPGRPWSTAEFRETLSDLLDAYGKIKGKQLTGGQITEIIQNMAFHPYKFVTSDSKQFLQQLRDSCNMEPGATEQEFQVALGSSENLAKLDLLLQDAEIQQKYEMEMRQISYTLEFLAERLLTQPKKLDAVLKLLESIRKALDAGIRVAMFDLPDQGHQYSNPANV